ncbi:MAG: 3-deoxy-8-phosphooctulonate synthase [Actinobacteria bacterium]|nr:3-deoxy-8-phosphooctulonate synthase [Actinomycetota bacterium]
MTAKGVQAGAVRADLGKGVLCGDGQPLVVIAGPCVVESKDLAHEVAERMKHICARLGIGYVFKASYDKANRTSLSGYRGPGRDEGLAVISSIGASLGIPVLTDIHETSDAAVAAKHVDALQIPAFLCRQTDLLLAAAATGKAINVKKGQFLAPWDMKNVVEKLRNGGATNVLVTERGTSFGYNTLVVDYRGLPQLRASAAPVIFDVTHSVQQPGGQGTSSGGQREYAGALARAAVAVGVDGLFLETHPDPDKAPSDGPNMIPLHRMEALLEQLLAIRQAVAARGPQPTTY